MLQSMRVLSPLLDLRTPLALTVDGCVHVGKIVRVAADIARTARPRPAATPDGHADEPGSRP